MRIIKTAAYGDPDIERFPSRFLETREDPLASKEWTPIGTLSRGGIKIEVEAVYTDVPGLGIEFSDFREEGTEKPLVLTEDEQDFFRRKLTDTQYFNESGQEYEH
jgi:hypothetical protein